MIMTNGCTVTTSNHADCRQLPEPDRKKCEGPAVTREMRPDGEVTVTRRRNQSDIQSTHSTFIQRMGVENKR
jgi:hypothetical protein